MIAERWLRKSRYTSRLWVRLALGFGSLVVLMVVVVVLAISQLRALAQQVEQVTRLDLQRMLLTQQVHQHAQGHGSAMARLLTASRQGRESIYPVVDAEYAAIERLLADLAARMTDANSTRQLELVVQRRHEYREIFTRVVEAIETGDGQQARSAFDESGQPALRALMDATTALLAHEQTTMQARQQEMQVRIRQFEWLLAALAGLALMLSIILAWRTTMSVARPLQRVEAATNRIAGGDYNTKVEVRGHDELGRVAQAINAMSSAVAAREAQIERLAFADHLTGLPNRTKLRELFQGKAACRLSVILMDVARLRTVNEVLGFETGDALLAEVAERLRQVVTAQTAGDMAKARNLVLARLAGGVFAVLWPGQDRAALEQLRERIDVAMASAADCGGRDVDVQMIYGLAEYAATSSVDIDAALRCAELALGQAKRNKAAWMWHVPIDDSARARQLNMLSHLRTAADSGELEMWMQPKQCIRNGKILGMEGLVRWRHPARGYVPPAEFIPFAERTGHIGVVTHAMIDAALAQLANWRVAHADLSIAINVSAQDVQHMSFVGRIKQLARRHHAPLNRLYLEITESSVMEDADRVLPVLHALRDLGVQLSIDDFGTGYSSLTYLHRLPVHELKIDRSFVAGADHQHDARALLRTIIELGHSLNLHVTAEGIERPEEMALLAQLGCDVAQGYLIARPMDPLTAKRYVATLGKTGIAATST